MNLSTHLVVYNLATSTLLHGSPAYKPRMGLRRMPPEVRGNVAEKSHRKAGSIMRVAIPFLML